jgi:hypothetical protein
MLRRTQSGVEGGPHALRFAIDVHSLILVIPWVFDAASSWHISDSAVLAGAACGDIPGQRRVTPARLLPPARGASLRDGWRAGLHEIQLGASFQGSPPLSLLPLQSGTLDGDAGCASGFFYAGLSTGCSSSCQFEPSRGRSLDPASSAFRPRTSYLPNRLSILLKASPAI